MKKIIVGGHLPTQIQDIVVCVLKHACLEEIMDSFQERSNFMTGENIQSLIVEIFFFFSIVETTRLSGLALKVLSVCVLLNMKCF